MRVFKSQEFGRMRDFESGAVFADMEFVGCRFMSCSISSGLDWTKRSTGRNIRLIGCEERACRVGAAILEYIFVDGLKTHGRLDTWGAAFKHVTLKGRIGNLKVSDYIPGVAGSAELAHRINLRFQAANAEYYKNVDWALDISQSEFEHVDIRGIPISLIRRDPETQVVVRREKAVALQDEWRKLDLTQTYWPIALQDVISEEHNDGEVFAAPKRHRNFNCLLAGLQALRRIGVAEPD